MSIVCLLPVRNGAAHLPRHFAAVRLFADAVVALDDGSTDETGSVLAAEPLVHGVLENPRREDYRGWDDALNRQRLLDAAAAFSPRWIIFLDADEALDAEDARALRGLLQCREPEQIAFGFRVLRMLDERDTFDDTAGMWAYRAFGYAAGQRLPERRLHFVPVPTCIPESRWRRTTLRIQHYAGTTAERRQARYDKYRQVDPRREYQTSYENILRPPVNVAQWMPRKADDSLFIAENLPDVPAAEAIATEAAAANVELPAQIKILGPTMRVVITNIVMGTRTGTEMYVRDLAFALIGRGHSVCVYSPLCGASADVIRARGVPVVDNLAKLDFKPDIIHGHHTAETTAALLHFPDTPAIFVCHDWGSWYDAPPKLARVRRYIAVDEMRRDRLTVENGIAEEQVSIVPNFVDLRRFVQRATWHEKPRKALVFSHSAAESTFAPAVRRACAGHALPVDFIGHGSGVVSDRPEEILHQYDIVFAVGRSALEAMASGAAVIMCDVKGGGEMITAENFAGHRRNNFGARHLYLPVRAEKLGEEIARYNAADAQRVSSLVAQQASVDRAVDALLEVYAQAIADHAGAAPVDRAAEARFAADLLRANSVYSMAIKAAADGSNLERQGHEAVVQDLKEQLQRAQEHIGQLGAALGNLEQSTRVRLITWLSETTRIGPVYRAVKRRGKGRNGDL